MINAALVGFGYWGPNIAKNLAASWDFRLYAICDVDKKRLEKAETLYGSTVEYYTDYRMITENPEIEMCAVALRNEPAQIVARAALKNGKHLFMEKPMAINIEDALLLQNLSKKNDVLIHVDHILVFNPVVRYIKKMIETGELGNLIYFESNRANLGPHIRNDMNVLWDLAVHDLAIIDYLNGGKSAVAVHCVGEQRFSKQEILTYLSVKYADNTAMIKSSWFSPVKDRTIIVCGEKKMVVFDDLKESEKLMIYDKGIDFDDTIFDEYGRFEAKIRTGDLYIPYIESEDAMQNGLIHFAECIRTGQQSITGSQQAVRMLDILQKADSALRLYND